MIKEIKIKDITDCVEVIRKSFSTVANEFDITIENDSICYYREKVGMAIM